jgi:hypothetical protein
MRYKREVVRNGNGFVGETSHHKALREEEEDGGKRSVG